MKKFFRSLSRFFAEMAGSEMDEFEMADIEGVWLTENQSSKVEIYRQNGKYIGRVLWAKGVTDEKGELLLDVNNPNRLERERPLIGLICLYGFVLEMDRWEGVIYDPLKGQKYAGTISVENRNILKVKGYLGDWWEGETVEWTRVN